MELSQIKSSDLKRKIWHNLIHKEYKMWSQTYRNNKNNWGSSVGRKEWRDTRLQIYSAVVWGNLKT